jgi:hypothetical protein
VKLKETIARTTFFIERIKIQNGFWLESQISVPGAQLRSRAYLIDKLGINQESKKGINLLKLLEQAASGS